MTRKAAVAEPLLSIADISRHFSLPESTTRYYCKRFAAFIPSVGEGRRRRYRQETLDVIGFILQEMRQSRTAAAVEATLHERFPQNALALERPTAPAAARHGEEQMFPHAALSLMERQATALEDIAGLLRQFLGRRDGQTGAPSGEEALRAMRRDVENLRILLESAEKTQQADLNQLRAWMGRIIRGKGGAAV